MKDSSHDIASSFSLPMKGGRMISYLVQVVMSLQFLDDGLIVLVCHRNGMHQVIS